MGAQVLIILGGVSLLAVALGVVAFRARRRELAARKREAEALALFELSKKLTAVPDPTEVAQDSVRLASTAVSREAALYLPGEAPAGLQMGARTAGYGAEAGALDVAEALFHDATAPTVSHTTHGLLLPVRSAGETLGVLAIAQGQSQPALEAEELSLLISYAGLVAVALEWATHQETTQRARLLEETERLQSALLNSISHDLRTPLASITGALSSLLEDEALLTPEARRELAMMAWEESIRLNRLVGNLLNMTRLQAGALHIICQPCDVEELVGAAMGQMTRRLDGRTVLRSIPRDLPPLSIDLVFMVQALVNVLDNALRYAPADEPVEIAARRDGDQVVITVMDRGPGLPDGDPEDLFGVFTRGSKAGGGGTGLGLSIAKGVVEAHNGRIWAENRPGGGAVFTIALDAAREPRAE